MPLGGAIVALIVMATVFFGGMRGAVWVNVLQTVLFIAFGLIAFAWIDRHIEGGFAGAVSKMTHDPSNETAPTPQGKMVTLLTRERIPWQMFLSFMLIPLSSIMFPAHVDHVLHCQTGDAPSARRSCSIHCASWPSGFPAAIWGRWGQVRSRCASAVAANSEPLKELLEASRKSREGRSSLRQT